MDLDPIGKGVPTEINRDYWGPFRGYSGPYQLYYCGLLGLIGVRSLPLGRYPNLNEPMAACMPMEGIRLFYSWGVP